MRARGPPASPADIRLDVGAMQEAAELLRGVHDYSAFADTKRPSGVVRERGPRVKPGGSLGG